jgi:hypothetical protein
MDSVDKEAYLYLLMAMAEMMAWSVRGLTQAREKV